ncbi:MAG: ATP-binding cassette domain-containing protein [Rhodospirillales bacterium]|nr:ATP-binding cassette domain-containing protein [Rhodospirillales bacterium]
MSINVQDVSVRFFGVVALSGVSLALAASEIVAVVGPNGSGKSTLFNSISGMVQLAGGRITVEGRDIRGVPPYGRVRLGIARTFQTPRFDMRESVERAVLCGFYPVARTGMVGAMLRLPRAAREEGELLESCHDILRDLRLFELRNVPLGELSMGQVRMVEVARAIANKPKYLLLDEPAAGLTRREQKILADEIRRLAAAGVGVLLVEHNFGLVRDLSQRVLVLDRGSVMMEGAPQEVQADESFVSLYLGSSGKAARGTAA